MKLSNLITFAAIALLVYAIFSVRSQPERPSSERYSSVMDPLISDGDIDRLPSTRAGVISRDFARDPIAADKKYKGNLFKITGVMVETGATLGNVIVVVRDVIRDDTTKFSKLSLVFLSQTPRGGIQGPNGRIVAACVGSGFTEESPVFDCRPIPSH